MRVALYSRVSSKDKRQETANQTNQLRGFSATQDWTIVQEYEDHDSGGKSDRPQFKAMMTDAAQRRFDCVLFWALDRFSREGPYETHVYLKRLDDAGVRFRSFTEPYLDTCGIFRDAVISLLATLAKQERLRIQERVRAGLDRARVQGTKSGNPVGRPKVIIDGERVVELRHSSCSWRQIARTLDAKVGTVRGAYKAATARQQACGNPATETL